MDVSNTPFQDWIDLDSLGTRVEEAKRLIVLFAWRKRTRGEPGVSVPKLTQHIEPFVNAIAKRRAFEMALAQTEALRLKHLLRTWKDALATRRLERFQKAVAFVRWKQSVIQARKEQDMNTRYALARSFRLWRAELRDRSIERALEDRLLYSHGISLARLSPAAVALHRWRLATRLRRLSLAHCRDTQRSTLRSWSHAKDRLQWATQAAEFHDKVRRLTPVLAVMTQKARRFNDALDFLAGHARMKRCHEIVGAWRVALKKRQLKRRYFDTFARKARFLFSAQEHAKRLAEATTRLRCLQLWRSRFTRRASKQGLLDAKAIGFDRRRIRSVLLFWRTRAQRLRTHSEMVEAWRTQEERRDVFLAWKTRAIVEYNCKAFYLRRQLRSGLQKWAKSLAERREARHLLSRTFSSWRHHTKAMAAARFFAASQLGRYAIEPARNVPSNLLTTARRSKTLGHVAATGVKARAFSTWNSSVSGVRALEQRYRVYVIAQQRSTLGRMRLVLRSHEHAEAQPRAELSRAWSRFKRVATANRQRQRVLEQRLSDHFGSQTFLGHFRHFKVWERAFQVRKMEEHLCEQNLAAYQYQQRGRILAEWKRLAAQRIFSQLSSLVTTRRTALNQWRRAARLAIGNRSRRILRRSLSLWRDALSEHRTRLLQAEMERRQRSRILTKWRRTSEHKYDLRFNRSESKLVATPWFNQEY